MSRTSFSNPSSHSRNTYQKMGLQIGFKNDINYFWFSIFFIVHCKAPNLVWCIQVLLHKTNYLRNDSISSIKGRRPTTFVSQCMMAEFWKLKKIKKSTSYKLSKQQTIKFWFQRILGIHLYNRRCYFYLFNL